MHQSGWVKSPSACTIVLFLLVLEESFFFVFRFCGSWCSVCHLCPSAWAINPPTAELSEMNVSVITERQQQEQFLENSSCFRVPKTVCRLVINLVSVSEKCNEQPAKRAPLCRIYNLLAYTDISRKRVSAVTVDVVYPRCDWLDWRWGF